MLFFMTYKAYIAKYFYVMHFVEKNSQNIFAQA